MFLNLKKGSGNLVQVKGSKFSYTQMMVAIPVSFIGMLFVLREGIRFESNYSLYYLASSMVFIPILVYGMLWYFPAFIPGKVLVTIIPGENGQIKGGRKSVRIKDIKEMFFYRRSINLMNMIMIETIDGKKVRIPTYSLLSDAAFSIMVDQFIFPYMNEQAKIVWDRQIDLDILYKRTSYKRPETEDTTIHH
ncbi:DUF5381 family protein [Mesobacillus zeae]|uniref:Uncharacterized protein n=1 Tax=Mesobacillus zeae TaxID=1917180 RepID=A0A398BA74_9BACI|nr:DUF5381 family protein [Mesobacillus zeae]RID86762.1 hypothetical protein D1970_05765 [Mesobacillus zeae]